MRKHSLVYICVCVILSKENLSGIRRLLPIRLFCERALHNENIILSHGTHHTIICISIVVLQLFHASIGILSLTLDSNSKKHSPYFRTYFCERVCVRFFIRNEKNCVNLNHVCWDAVHCMRNAIVLSLSITNGTHVDTLSIQLRFSWRFS